MMQYIATEEDDVVIDIFGGSGTTVHSVLLLNKNDESNRKFILSEQNHMCKVL